MKTYAILGPRLRVFRTIESETEPRAQRFAEITAEQATTIADGQGYFLIEGTLYPMQELFQTHYWNEETASWDVYVPPVPTTVPRYEFLGQLAKEVQTGEDEQLKQALASMGDNIKTLLHHMIAQADMPEQARAQAHNEIDEARTFLRAHPFIDQIGPAFGYITDEQKDEFFHRAAVYKFGA